MCDTGESEYVRLEVGDSDSVEEVVLAYREDGELHELAGVSPPVQASLEKRDV